MFLVSLCVGIVKEAITRLFKPEEIENPDLMFYTGLMGLLINILGMFIFGHGHGHSHNIQEDQKIEDNSDNEENLNSMVQRQSNGISNESYNLEINHNSHQNERKAKIDIKMDKKNASKALKKKACCAILCK